MNRISQVFQNAINRMMEEIEAEPDGHKRALIYGEIAKACAMTGLVKLHDETEEKIYGESPESEDRAFPSDTTRESLVRKAVDEPGDVPFDVPEKEKTIEDVQSEIARKYMDNWDGKWTQEAVDAFEKEWGVIGAIIDDYGEEPLNQCLEQFFERKATVEDISPNNIKAVAAMIESLMAESGEAA